MKSEKENDCHLKGFQRTWCPQPKLKCKELRRGCLSRMTGGYRGGHLVAHSSGSMVAFGQERRLGYQGQLRGQEEHYGTASAS